MHCHGAFAINNIMVPATYGIGNGDGADGAVLPVVHVAVAVRGAVGTS